MVDRHPRIINDRMNNAEGIRLRHPAVVVHRPRAIALSRSVDVIDRHDLPLFRFFADVVVLEAPPCGSVAAKGFPPMGRICTWARTHVDEANLQYVARLCASHRYGSRANVYAETASRADLVIHRTRATAVNILLLLVPT